MAIAPPAVVVHDIDGLAADPRPKLLALAQHDEYRDPAEVTELAERWANTDVHVVGGASHFFVGRTDRLVELASGYVDRLAPAPRGLSYIFERPITLPSRSANIAISGPSGTCIGGMIVLAPSFSASLSLACTSSTFT